MGSPGAWLSQPTTFQSGADGEFISRPDAESTNGTAVGWQVFAIIGEIRRRGTTVSLAEQNARMALSVADRGYVLETGHLAVSGKPAELWSSDAVRAAYLGVRVEKGLA